MKTVLLRSGVSIAVQAIQRGSLRAAVVVSSSIEGLAFSLVLPPDAAIELAEHLLDLSDSGFTAAPFVPPRVAA